MKRIIVVVLLVFICLSVSVSTNALSIIDSSDTTVIFRKDSTFTELEKQKISLVLQEQSLLGEDNPRNIICDLFGHSYNEELVTTITHKVRSTQPRCREETYLVKICSRCSYTQTDRISFDYIYCCE